jgi:hypothetical protein
MALCAPTLFGEYMKKHLIYLFVGLASCSSYSLEYEDGKEKQDASISSYFGNDASSFEVKQKRDISFQDSLSQDAEQQIDINEVDTLFAKDEQSSETDSFVGTDSILFEIEQEKDITQDIQEIEVGSDIIEEVEVEIEVGSDIEENIPKDVSCEELKSSGKNVKLVSIIYNASEKMYDYDGYLMDKYPILWRDYEFCVEKGKCDPIPWDYDNVNEYKSLTPDYKYDIAYLSEKYGEQYCKFVGGSLPTEFQLQKALTTTTTQYNSCTASLVSTIDSDYLFFPMGPSTSYACLGFKNQLPFVTAGTSFGYNCSNVSFGVNSCNYSDRLWKDMPQNPTGLGNGYKEKVSSLYCVYDEIKCL